jgi:anti-sigma regulatory factor (Ser/Thr protein kinase)
MWHVVRVPDLERWGPLPAEGVLGVQDLPEAVARIGLKPGDPVYVGPDGTVDTGLLDFVRSKEFRNLERESKRNYATDIRILLEFLSSRGVSWREATETDLADFRDWRCRAPENPQRISGTKWNREAAAFTKLFKWGRVYPLPVDVSRRENRAADSVSSRVSWLTPRTWGLWSDVGLRGHTRAGVAAPGWESRTEIRNTSFVQLLLSSGLRRQEGGSLLTFELPTQQLRHGRYLHGRIAGVAARTALRQALGGLDLGCETIDDAVLAVSELVANASAYATGPYELRMRRTDAEVICEVQDADPRIPDIPHPPSAAPFVAKQEDCGGGLEALQVALTERGRGLQIVDYLSGGSVRSSV